MFDLEILVDERMSRRLSCMAWDSCVTVKDFNQSNHVGILHTLYCTSQFLHVGQEIKQNKNSKKKAIIE